jgi:peptide chain release factor 2
MRNIQDQIKLYEKLQNEIKQSELGSKQKQIKKQLEFLQKQASAADFWQNKEKAQKISSEIGNLEKELAQIANLQQLKDDIDFLIAEIEKDKSLELIQEFAKYLQDYKAKVNNYKLKTFLNGKFDSNNAIFSIFAGQGGTEANDWAEMLMRMYLRYFANMEWKTEILDKAAGAEAGISRVSMKVIGKFAYGYCKVEHGTHRLVRISPYNAQKLRQTSFAGVEVTPILEDQDNQEIEIKTEDIEFSAVRSSGAGGQHVNKVATAVRIKHIPTNIQVSCSSGKSQLQNKKHAMEMLKGKLALIQEQEKQEKIKKEKGETFKASWGNQIRNYVLHPYKLVKDVRTQVETDKVESVLDGDLERFINAGIIYLSKENKEDKKINN